MFIVALIYIIIGFKLVNVYCEDICLSNKLQETLKNQDQFRLEALFDFGTLNDSKLTLKASRYLVLE